MTIIHTEYVRKRNVLQEKEINDHLKLFGKESWEVDYGEKCPLCNVRIDEYDMCGCGSTGLEYFLPIIMAELIAIVT